MAEDLRPPKRAEVETYIRRAATEIASARAAGAADPAAIAEALNRRGFTTRKGRPWTEATVRKFLSSPGAQRLGLRE